MGKFFFKPEEHTGETVIITGNTAHHMLHVLRFRIGQEIILCDGRLTDFSARLASFTERPTSITFKLISHSTSKSEAAFKITLYQGLPKSDKMDWIIEKCIEAGVHKIVPVYTARTVSKVKDLTKKSERFMRIAESAASQSMRGIIPEVSLPKSFADAISECGIHDLCLVAYENENASTIKSSISSLPPRSVSLWVGPEGGFEDSEINALKEKGTAPITLGPRILRTETAGLVAISQILCLWET